MITPGSYVKPVAPGIILQAPDVPGRVIQTISKAPRPPEGSSTLVIIGGSNGAHPEPLAAISPGSVTLQHAVMLTDVEQVAVHPFTSVTVTEYEPAVRLLMLTVVAPVLHRYVYGAVPPVADTEAEATFPLLQSPLVGVHVATTSFG